MDALEADAVVAFGAFADRLNFTTAAQALHISQPALHVKVQKLARSLGQTLYQRRGRHLVLTPAGEALARFARDQHGRVEAFRKALDGTSDRPLVLAAGRGAFLDVIGDALAVEVGRGTSLKLVVGHAAETLTLVDQHRADVAVGVFGDLSPGIASWPLRTDGQVLALPPGHAWANRDAISIRDLDGVSLVVPPRNWPHRALVATALLNGGVSWRVAAEVDGWDLMIQFVQLGVAPAVISGSVRTPKGVVTIPVHGIPETTYSAIARVGASEPVVALVSRLRRATGQAR